MNQLDRIMEVSNALVNVRSILFTIQFNVQVTGRPSAEDIDAVQSPFAATMLDSLPPTRQKRAQEVIVNHL